MAGRIAKKAFDRKDRKAAKQDKPTTEVGGNQWLAVRPSDSSYDGGFACHFRQNLLLLLLHLLRWRRCGRFGLLLRLLYQH